MKNIFLCLLLFSVSWVAEASETTFADIQKRVAERDAITKAIMAIDEGRVFELLIKNDAAEIRIYRYMKTEDPMMEKYTFKLTDEILQEYARLELQKELQKFIEKCSLSERKYRVSQFKERKLSLGMPYPEVKKLLGRDFKDGSPRAMAGSMSLESDEYIIAFSGFGLFDILAKNPLTAQYRHGYYLFVVGPETQGQDRTIPMLLTSNALEQVAEGRPEQQSVLVITYERDSVFYVKSDIQIPANDVRPLERQVRVQVGLEPQSTRWYRYQEVSAAEVHRLLEHPQGTIPVHRPGPSREKLNAILSAFRKDHL
jgi:hypothetical protein